MKFRYFAKTGTRPGFKKATAIGVIIGVMVGMLFPPPVNGDFTELSTMMVVLKYLAAFVGNGLLTAIVILFYIHLASRSSSFFSWQSWVHSSFVLVLTIGLVGGAKSLIFWQTKEFALYLIMFGDAIGILIGLHIFSLTLQGQFSSHRGPQYFHPELNDRLPLFHARYIG